MSDFSEPLIYRLKIILLSISPMIWRRVLVSSNSTIEDLHYTIQLAMGWEDIHLHHFIFNPVANSLHRKQLKAFLS
jgi:Plasmid pRiA4b ORF-3-like protein